MPGERRVSITSDADIVTARHEGRQLAVRIGFPPLDLTIIATAISELARNIVLYAKKGEIVVSEVRHGSRRGIKIVATDEGPGIPDLSLAMQDGYSTGGSLGLGLPGAKRLMDEFEIRSDVEQGTTVSIIKWMP